MTLDPLPPVLIVFVGYFLIRAFYFLEAVATKVKQQPSDDLAVRYLAIGSMMAAPIMSFVAQLSPHVAAASVGLIGTAFLPKDGRIMTGFLLYLGVILIGGGLLQLHATREYFAFSVGSAFVGYFIELVTSRIRASSSTWMRDGTADLIPRNRG